MAHITKNECILHVYEQGQSVADHSLLEQETSSVIRNLQEMLWEIFHDSQNNKI